MRECWTNRNSHDPATAAPRPQVLIDRDELDRLRGTLQQQRIALQSLLQTRGCLTVDGQPEVAAELSLWTRPAPVQLQNRQLPDGDRATLCDPCSDHLRGRLLHTLDNDVPDRHQLALFGGDS